jgi:DNA-binding GntR family transcriptional regulator
MRSVHEPQVRAFAAKAEALASQTQPPPPSLPGYIAGWIADRIQFGDLKPGDPIRELMVADHFDVSRGPVRDALRLLDRDGLVAINGRKGASVRAFSRVEVAALFRIRAELFGVQASLAATAKGRDPQILAALIEGAELLAVLAGADPPAPVGEYITVRRATSWLIAHMSGNSYMALLLAQLEREVSVLWASVLRPDRRRQSAVNWMALCRAIHDGDAAQAELLGAALVLDGLAEIERRWTESGMQQA